MLDFPAFSERCFVLSLIVIEIWRGDSPGDFFLRVAAASVRIHWNKVPVYNHNLSFPIVTR